MENIQHDLSPAALVSAIEANLYEMFLTFRHWPQAEVYDEPGSLACLTDIPLPLFNCVLRARFAPETVDADIAAVLARYQSRRVPLLWITGPSDQPAGLAPRLRAHGLVYDEDTPGMAVDLLSLPAEPALPPGLLIEPVSGVEALRAWCQVQVEGFGLPAGVAEALFNWHASLVGRQVPLFNYVARLNGRPVAASMLLLAAGVAGLYNVTTLPEARYQGIGAAMTLRPLLEARGRGYRLGVLQASAMGASVYRRLGFRDYCQFGSYAWTSAEGRSNTNP